MIAWLASWVGFPLDTALPVARQRAVVSEAMLLMRWRGTHYGLTRLLELCTNWTPEIGTADDHPAILTIRIKDPETDKDRPFISRALVERLIEQHKPAHCGYRVEWLT
jgi:hypothetical protein